jgi:hypothetical protein
MVNYIQEQNDTESTEPINDHKPIIFKPLLKMTTTFDLNELSFHSGVPIEKLNEIINGIQINFNFNESELYRNLMYDITAGYLYYKYPQYKLFVESAYNLDKMIRKIQSEESPKEILKDLILRIHEFISLYEENVVVLSSNQDYDKVPIDINELSFNRYGSFLSTLSNMLFHFGFKLKFDF